MNVTAIKLPHFQTKMADTLALGAWLKATVCVAHSGTAFVSEPIGDLVDAEACEALENTARRLCQTHRVRPRIIAHDLHPDFFSTRLARRLADEWQVSTLGVQHHHAHIAAVCAEHHLTGAVLGLAMDGVGLGTDGQAWGGELLLVERDSFQRLSHLEPLSLPGGDRAARETWRMAAAALARLGRADEIKVRFTDRPAASTVFTMLERNFNCPTTTSLGRLFDAAAGLLGLCHQQSFEGEAAMALEALAAQHGPVVALKSGYNLGTTLDFRPLLAQLADTKDDGYAAALFHATLAAGLADWVSDAAKRYHLNVVASGGGCFLNRLLRQQLTDLLGKRGIKLLTANRVSPGDSGLSLGQCWVAIRHLQGS